MPTTPNTPGAFLEQAVVNLLQASMRWTPMFVKRMHDAQPPPAMGQWFASVWSPNTIRTGPAIATSLDQYRGVNVTITVRFVLPFDRWVIHRDALEERANDIIALIHKDSYNRVISNAANTLAGYRAGNAPDGVHAVGFVEGLQYEGSDAVQEVGSDWFHAHPDKGADQVGIAQTLRFGKCRRVQSKANME